MKWISFIGLFIVLLAIYLMPALIVIAFIAYLVVFDKGENSGNTNSKRYRTSKSQKANKY